MPCRASLGFTSTKFPLNEHKNKPTATKKNYAVKGLMWQAIYGCESFTIMLEQLLSPSNIRNYSPPLTCHESFEKPIAQRDATSGLAFNSSERHTAQSCVACFFSFLGESSEKIRIASPAHLCMCIRLGVAVV